MKNTLIKFNGGNPVALCLVCGVIMCYVDILERDSKHWVVALINSHSIDGLKRFDKVPLCCKDCTAKELMIEKFEY